MAVGLLLPMLSELSFGTKSEYKLSVNWGCHKYFATCTICVRL